MFLGYALQAVGLMFTTASRSCFLLYLNVKIVPVLSAVLFRRQVSALTWTSAAIAVFGTTLLSYDGGPPNAGDFWSIMAAVASAMFILRLDTHVGKFSSSLSLTSALTGATSLYCLVWAACELLLGASAGSLSEVPARIGAEVAALAQDSPAQILYLGLVTTAFTSVLQALGQSKVSPERAALIYAADPVWGAGFAYLLLGETLGVNGLIGAALISGAAIGSQLLTPKGDEDKDRGAA
uniref:EamA domain-containing protein n=1 Tax=Phaeomonas parva TaxID=124430 RepID=A0A7S1U884_9STRA|mmetsp:Transcript_34765/g.109162  ORF Transcript_34765/g.109162 Transcript_34765/m.109162 type:complete len:238 (+) Transcript_34765:51-764(+)